MNEPYLTMSGVVGSDVRAVLVDDHLPITSFRMGSTTRRYDRASGGWVDGETTWVTVTCFRSLARNVSRSVARRDRVVVHGKLRVRRWKQDDGQVRTNVEIEADSVGHDLTFGTSVFVRTPRGEGTTSAERVPEEDSGGGEGTGEAGPAGASGGDGAAWPVDGASTAGSEAAVEGGDRSPVAEGGRPRARPDVPLAAPGVGFR